MDVALHNQDVLACKIATKITWGLLLVLGSVSNPTADGFVCADWRVGVFREVLELKGRREQWAQHILPMSMPRFSYLF